jgi:hypothetical protein
MRRVKTHLVLSAVLLATAFAGTGGGLSGQAAAASATPHSGTLTSSAPLTVVARGLHSPRNLAWGPRGRMLVAETGAPPLTAPSECNFHSEEIVFEMRCFGMTGSIADVSSGTPKRIVTGLASNLNQQEMVGPNDLAYVDGKLYVLETGAPQVVPTWLSPQLQAPLKRQYGALLDVTRGSTRVVANPGSVDYEWMKANPELQTSPPAANLYAMTPKPGGGFYTVDAAANTLDLVDRRGKVHVLAWFPRLPNGSDAVPTCLDVGPDGAVYIGQLTGHGNSGEAGAKAANVYRYSPRSGKLTVWQTGLGAITGCGFGAKGDFYVTQLSTTGFLPTGDPEGVVVQIAPNGTRTVLGKGKLFAPSGFLAGDDGSIYVANNTIWWPAGTTGEWNEGEVVKIG